MPLGDKHLSVHELDGGPAGLRFGELVEIDAFRREQRRPEIAHPLRRSGSVRIVKSRVSKPSSISFHVTGVEAPAKSLARALYAQASDFPSMFCR